MVDSMQDGDTIRSDLNVWLNKMVMKKWYYDGCPHCNKVTEENNTCPHCQKFVNKTVPHFIMRVEISDPYGSIWSTAYDEFAGKIFKEDDLIQKLLRYDIN